MNLLDVLFPYIEPLTGDETKTQKEELEKDVAAIEAVSFSIEPQRALDEAQRAADGEAERVRTAEGKATTYLAVLAALVPLVLTLQAATWESKTGPAPDALKLGFMLVATIYVAAAGYHAFKTLQVSGFQRVVEGEIAAAWRNPDPLQKLTRSTLLASRRSRDAVNAKVTRIKVTHEHLVRAFGGFVLLLALDPLFYAVGYRGDDQAKILRSSPVRAPKEVVPRTSRRPASMPQADTAVDEAPVSDKAALPERTSSAPPTDPKQPFVATGSATSTRDAEESTQ